MQEERITEIQQNERVYRYVRTEELIIGGTIWMRDRYCNVNGDKSSFLLLNFENTNIPVGMTLDVMQEPLYPPEPEPAPKPRRDPMDYRKYIQAWREKGIVK